MGSTEPHFVFVLNYALQVIHWGKEKKKHKKNNCDINMQVWLILKSEFMEYDISQKDCQCPVAVSGKDAKRSRDKS